MTLVQKFHQWRKRPNKSIVAEYLETFIIILPIAFLIRTVGYGLYKVPTGSMETTILVGEGFFSDKFTPLFIPIKHGDIIALNDPTFIYSDNYWVDLFQRYVWGPTNWTKRVIGIPGDHIRGVIEDGKPVVYRNDVKLDEPYLNKFPLITLYKNNRIQAPRSYDPAYSYSDQPFYSFNDYEAELGKRWSDMYGQEWLLMPGTPSFDHYGRNVDIFDVHLAPNQYWCMGDNRLGSKDSRFLGPFDGKLIHGKIVFRIWSIDSNESWLIFDLIKHPLDFWKRIRWNRFLQRVS